MEKVKIVVWDKIGNTILGMRAWDQWSEDTQDRLLTEDPNARERVVSFDDLFKNYDVELVWLYDPIKSQRGFRDLFNEHQEHLKAVTGPQDVIDAIKDADYLVFHKEQLPALALIDAHKLKLIQHLGGDHRGVNLDAAWDMQIPVAATPLINYSAVAEHVWALILDWVKRLPDQRDYMQSRTYLQPHGWGAYHPGVTLLSDMTLGLVGMGEIARPIARVAKAFNMRVIYWDIVRFARIEEQYGLEFVEWDELFQQSDILSVQLALNEKTEGIIGAKEFAMMKPTALYINTARGRLADQGALVAALEVNQIGGAALDVFYDEPLPGDSPLHDLHEAADHRVLLTPHSAAQGPWTWIRDSQEIWFNIMRSLNGEELKHLVPESYVPGLPAERTPDV